MPEKHKPVLQELELASLNPLEDELSRLESLSAKEQKEPLKEFLKNHPQFLFAYLPTHEELIGPVCDILEGHKHLMWELIDKTKDYYEDLAKINDRATALTKLIEPILTSIKGIKCEALMARLLQQFLTQKDEFHRTALMLAAKYHPDAVASILEGMRSIKDEEQTLILTQITRECIIKGKNRTYLTIHFNALMLAACNQPNAVAPILGSINSIKDEKQRTEILTQTTTNGWNALMLAAYDQPNAVAPILQSMENNHTLLGKVLTEQVVGGWNALMMAAYNQPEAVDPILQSMKNNPTLLKKVLTEQSVLGWNALMFAAYYHPEAVDPILQSMKNNPTLLEKVLTQKDKYGWNALMRALRYHPDSNSVGSILTFAKDSAPTLHKMLSIASKKLASSQMVKLRECFLSIDFGNLSRDEPPHENTETIKTFNKHLQVMKADLFRIGCKTGEGYSHRFNAEHKLTQELEKARNLFFQNGNNDQFIQSSKDALNTAKPVLGTHRGLGGFFNEPTTSGAHLDSFLDFLETLSPGTAPKPSH